MRRFLRSVLSYPVGFARWFSGGWNAFWFTPADPTLLGLIRILTGSIVLYAYAIWGLALFDFFGPYGWISPDLVRFIQQNQTAYSLWWLVPPKWIWPAYIVSMAILALFAAGLWTRFTSILALVVEVSFVNRVPEALFGLDKIYVMLTLYLAIGPSGAALSVDRWLARRRLGPKAAAPALSAAADLAQRLIQVHMCIIYLFAGLSKLQGAVWWNGEAMWLALANVEYRTADTTWLAWHPWVLNLITHFTVIWEISFCVLIWLPMWRPLVLAGAVLLHAGIGAFLGLWTFSLIMLVGCTSFLPNEGVRHFFAALSPSRVDQEIAEAGAKPRSARATAESGRK